MKSLLLAGLFSLALGASALTAADSPKDAPKLPEGYPLKTCVVSGEELGEMGAPYLYTYKQEGKPDRIVALCCKKCVAKFEKDPAKYLAKIDAAAAGKDMAADSSAGCMDGSCGKGEPAAPEHKDHN